MQRALAVLSVASLLVGCVNGSRTTTSIDGSPPSPSGAADANPSASASASALRDASNDGALVEKGKMLYGRYCDFCHGKEGKGYAADEAPALANDDLLATASDEFLSHAIMRGRPGTTMSSWAVARGGPLGVGEAAAIIAYMRTWQKRPSEVASVDARTVNGDAARGAAVYAASCASCHGQQGRGGKYNALANAELLASAKDGFLATTVERGRAGTPMTAFTGKLSAQAIDDVTALLRSWQRPAEEDPPLPPKPGALRAVVLNKGGPEPAFEAKADFVPVDVVKRELDKRASLVIVDARAPGDYAIMHIAGAISVPFYQVDAYAPQIPKDRWVLTYCACPHAASVKARDALRALGYTRVAVLDEGINTWRDRGYPVRGGAKP